MSALPPHLLAAIEQLHPLVMSSCVRARRDGRLADEVVHCADRHGLFATRVPAELGGHDLSLEEAYLLTEALSYLDGSTGWTQSFMSLSAGLVGGHIGESGAHALLAANSGRWPRFAGTFPTLGVATPADGGVTVRGSWPFASGISHAQWVAAGCVPAGAAPGDRTAVLWIAVPIEACRVRAGSWDVDAMQATGSSTFDLHDAFVPQDLVFTIGAPQERGRLIHKLATLVFISPEHAGVALGLARRALHEVARIAVGKQRMGGRAPLAERGAFTRDLGRADVALRAARTMMLEHFRTADATNDPTALGARFVADIRACAAHAASVATEVATLAYRYAGGSALARSHPLHAAWADVLAATQHVHTNDENYETWGEIVASEARLG